MDEELLYTQEDIDEWVRTCEELQERVKEQEETIEQLSEYKRLEEQGLIVRLPCKAGDKLYCINTFRPTPIIETFIISKIEITGNYAKYIILKDYKGNRFFSEYIGETYFLTRAEAEKKLKELKEEE